MTVTPKTMKAKASPLFDEVCDEDLQDAINTAVLLVSESNWGARYDDGVFFLASHFLTELESLKASGSIAASANAVSSSAIRSEKIKSWSVTYADVSSSLSDDPLSTTSWGRMFIARRNLVFSCRVI